MLFIAENSNNILKTMADQTALFLSFVSDEVRNSAASAVTSTAKLPISSKSNIQRSAGLNNFLAIFKGSNEGTLSSNPNDLAVEKERYERFMSKAVNIVSVKLSSMYHDVALN